jgi:hypothetical protein
MAVTFHPATKAQARARIGLTGPAGSGKTYTALSIAAALGPKIALIDTEHGSASKYADEFQFDVLELDNFHPRRFVEAMDVAGRAGYDVLIIDSASHEWYGAHGCLELVDREATAVKGNRWAAWNKVTPLHNLFIEALHAVPMHLIVTLRTKMAYVEGTNDKGNKVIEKVGMEAITRDGMEYELDIVGDLDLAHTLRVTKTRARTLDGAVLERPGADFAQVVHAWLSDGAPVAPPAAPKPASAAPPPATAAKAGRLSNDKAKELWAAAQAHQPPIATVNALLEYANLLLGTAHTSLRDLTPDQAAELLTDLHPDNNAPSDAEA